MPGPTISTFLSVLLIVIAMVIWWRATVIITTALLLTVLVVGAREVVDFIDQPAIRQNITGPTPGAQPPPAP